MDLGVIRINVLFADVGQNFKNQDFGFVDVAEEIDEEFSISFGGNLLHTVEENGLNILTTWDDVDIFSQMTEQYLFILHFKTSTNAEIAEIECLVLHLEIELHIFQHV